MSVFSDPKPTQIGSGGGFLTAAEAAAELGISKATLYAYVSRGLIRSTARDGSRRRLYDAGDVRALTLRRHPEGDRGARTPLDWGTPVLTSALTLIRAGKLFYRGRDAAILATQASLPSLATLLWDCGDDDPFSQIGRAGRRDPAPDKDAPVLPSPLLPPTVTGALAALATLRDRESRVFDLSPRGVAATGAQILRLLIRTYSGHNSDDLTAEAALAQGWGLPSAAEPSLRAAMILCADHELNASTFTVRCIAGAGATPVDGVIGGIAALRGARHGGATLQSRAWLAGILAQSDPEAACLAAIRRGEAIPGFGHTLYPQMDPRYVALLEILRQPNPIPNSVPDLGGRIGALVHQAKGEAPTIDFALAILALHWGLDDEASFALFLIGRSIGWIAHFQEQAQSSQMIRPRARYNGLSPTGIDCVRP